MRRLEADPEEEGRSRHEVLKYAVVVVLGFLSSFEKEVERIRRWVGIMDRLVNPHRHRRVKVAGQAQPADVESE